MTARAIFLVGLPAVLGLSYGTAWLTATLITRNCNCDFCQQTPEDLL